MRWSEAGKLQIRKEKWEFHDPDLDCCTVTLHNWPDHALCSFYVWNCNIQLCIVFDCAMGLWNLVFQTSHAWTVGCTSFEEIVRYHDGLHLCRGVTMRFDTWKERCVDKADSKNCVRSTYGFETTGSLSIPRINRFWTHFLFFVVMFEQLLHHQCSWLWNCRWSAEQLFELCNLIIFLRRHMRMWLIIESVKDYFE